MSWAWYGCHFFVCSQSNCKSTCLCLKKNDCVFIFNYMFSKTTHSKVLLGVVSKIVYISLHTGTIRIHIQCKYTSDTCIPPVGVASLHVCYSYGISGSTNIQGEEVKKLDVLANDLFINMIRSSFTTCLMVSEENDNVIEVETEKQVNLVGARSYSL